METLELIALQHPYGKVAKMSPNLKSCHNHQRDRTDNNSWPEWPKILRTDYGQQEAIAKYGQDPRVFETMTISFKGNESGEITAINTIKVEWKSENNRFIPVPIKGTEKKLSADLVLLAMGFTMPENNC